MASPPVPLTPFGSALAGALGAVFSNAVVYPLDTVKTRLQALPRGHLDPNDSVAPAPRERRVGGMTSLPRHLILRIKRWEMLRMLIKIIRTEGIGGAFKGFSANMINTFSQQFAYFFFHTLLRTAAIRRLSSTSTSPSSSPPKSLSTSMELLLGALAGGLGQIFTIPVSVIATRQQLWMPDTKSGQPQTEPSFLQTAEEIIAEGGPTALWTGLKPGLVLTVNPAITYGVFERAKSYVLSGSREGGKLGVGEAFWIGVGSKTLATIVTYPYIFAKVRLQAKQMEEHQSDPSGASNAPEATSNEKNETSYAAIASHPPASDAPVVSVGASSPVDSAGSSRNLTQRPRLKRGKTGAIQLLRKVYATQGLWGWYQGLGAQIVKAVLCQGILFVSKEHFEVYAAMILAFLGRLRSRVPLPIASK